MSLNRHQMRESAFKMIFAQSVNPDVDPEELKKQVLEEFHEADVADPFLNNLVTGVQENESAINDTISKELKAGWTVKRLANPDRVILQIGTYEIKYTEIPNSVAINEALELAKKYTDEKARKFINGVLSNVAKD
ncbi:transcription antitermination factor NusB [Pediococcus acidilactici]